MAPQGKKKHQKERDGMEKSNLYSCDRDSDDDGNDNELFTINLLHLKFENIPTFLEALISWEWYVCQMSMPSVQIAYRYHGEHCASFCKQHSCLEAGGL